MSNQGGFCVDLDPIHNANVNKKFIELTEAAKQLMITQAKVKQLLAQGMSEDDNQMMTLRDTEREYGKVVAMDPVPFNAIERELASNIETVNFRKEH